VHVSARRFEELVAEALDSLPHYLLEHTENVAVLAEDRPTPEQLAATGAADLFGLYEGTGTKPTGIMPRGWAPNPFQLPDRITVFRSALSAASRDETELRARIRDTLVHEFAHHFGIDDDRLDELGW
jgi:predicted Zn-dependent protease with MMP-like domain